MSRDPFAGRAADLINGAQTVQASGQRLRSWQDAAESCVLARMDTLRLVGGLPRHQPPLSTEERVSRLERLLGFWSDGCVCVVDEALFADIANRHRPTGR